MAKILFITWAERGHLNASFKLAKTLKSRGHGVSYATVGDFQDYISSHGFEVIPFFESLFPKGFIDSVPSGAPLFDALAATLKSVGAKYGKADQDLLSEEVASIATTMEADLLILDSHLGIMIPLADVRITRPSILLNTTVKFPLEENSPKYSDPMFAWTLKTPTLFLCPEEFDLPRSKSAGDHYYAEACVDMRRKDVEFPWDRLCPDDQLIYCSLGTQSHWSFNVEENEFNQGVRKRFLQNVIDAVAGKRHAQLALSIGNHLSEKDFNAVPPNFILVNAAPQLEILKRASLMITHGGLNTIKECILFGVPMIVFPLQGDQPGNAARVAYHHLGIWGNIETASVSEIREMINLIDNDLTFDASIERMSRIFKAKEDAGLAVKFIESIVDGRAA